MKDLYDFFLKFLAFLNIPVTAWTFALFIILFFLRQRIVKALNNLLDLIGRTFANEASCRRFEPTYKALIRPAHLYLKIVGIRTEEERRPSIVNAYVPLKLLPKGESIEYALSVDQIVQDHSYHLILGDPGAGKSTILNYLTTSYTEAPRRGKKGRKLLHALPYQSKTSPLCPIYVPLRRCRTKNKTLLADISDEDTEILPEPIRQKMPKRFIEYCIKHGRALMLLDGLDEVADEYAYRDVVQKVNEFIQLYPKNKVVVTCRKAGWRGDLSPDFQIHSVLSLDTQQQHQFVHKWYAAILQYTSLDVTTEKHDLQRRSEREANHLLTLLQTKERLRELASNPLILSLICLVHKQRKDLPRGRAALYRDCLDILLELWDRIDKDEFDQQYPGIEQKKRMLRHIAYRMHTNGLREIDRKTLEAWALEFLPHLKETMTAADIVHQIEVRSGVMAERSIDKLAFSHQTLQEFLVVEYFLHERNGNIALDTITDWASWREPILLMCGMKNEPMLFLKELYTLQPLLALSGIAEADPTKLDFRTVQQLVDDAIERIRTQTIEINEAAPALISLLSIEGNPFGESILTVIYTRIRECSIEQASKIIEALSKIRTRKSAKILLSLLAQSDLGELETVLIDGLARIGDNALYEALEWRESGKLSETQLFTLLASCSTPFASRTLWSRYQLKPPPSQELTWAKAWALRLAEKETGDLLRPLLLPGPGITDSRAWPYHQNDRCALAGLVTKAFSILHERYGSYSDIGKDVHMFSRFSLRLQVPLIAYAQSNAALPLR